jgi:DNA-binding CsgD family transcriptional regulator
MVVMVIINLKMEIGKSLMVNLPPIKNLIKHIFIKIHDKTHSFILF